MHTNNFIEHSIRQPLFSDTCIGYIDFINPDANVVAIKGWGLVRKGEEFLTPSHFIIVYDGEVIGKALPNMQREDVAVVFPGAPELCGFIVEIPGSLVPKNPLDYLAVYVETPDGSLGEMEGPDGLSAPMHPAVLARMPQQLKPLLATPEINGIALSLTSNCNLRCSYCCIQHGDYVFMDMEEGVVENILEQTNAAKMQEVCLGLSGEPTLSKNFVPIAKKLIDNGICLSCTSNFARLLTDDEFEVLSKFHTIEVSIDTFNRDHLKKVRHPVKLENIVYNILQIKIIAKKHRRVLPNFTFNVVLNELTVFDFPDLINAADLLGISHFQIFYMREPTKDFDFSQCPKQLNDSSKREEIGQVLKTSILELERLGITYSIENELLHFIVPDNLTPQKETRLCIHPWSHLFVLADGVALSCSFIRTGFINSSTDLAALFNGSRIQRLRYELLSGNLRKECATCSLAEPCSLQDLRDLLADFSSSSKPIGAFGDPVPFITKRVVRNKSHLFQAPQPV